MSGLTDILKDPAFIKFKALFDLVAFPINYMNKLEVDQPYEVDQVFKRLTALKVLDCDLDFFKKMIDMEEGFHIYEDQVFRKEVK